MVLDALVRVEALVSGMSSISLELIIMAHLLKSGRLMYYYHMLPIFSGVLLVLSSLQPQNAVISIAATLGSCGTALNMYNTYYVQVVMLRKYLEPLRLEGSTDEVVQDLFLPRYRAAFYPWGPISQLVYSIVVCTHILARSFALEMVIR